jgi:anti-anti-sigma factor
MFRIETCSHQGKSALRLEGELTIYHVLEARTRLDAALDLDPALRLDLSGLEELDTAGVQLLVWLGQEANRRGKTLAWLAPSPAVLEIFELLQVAPLFGSAHPSAPLAS